MQYKLHETREAVEDVAGMAEYIVRRFANPDAALSFLNQYDKEVQRLMNFPFGYRGVSFEYRGYEIRIKSFDTYNIFFTYKTCIEECISSQDDIWSVYPISFSNPAGLLKLVKHIHALPLYPP